MQNQLLSNQKPRASLKYEINICSSVNPETVVTNDCISPCFHGKVHVYTDQDKKYSP